MTLADQAAITSNNGEVTQSRPTRRTFTKDYKTKILAEYDQAGPGQRGAILRREGLLTSHISDWKKMRDKGTRDAVTQRKSGRPPAKDASTAEIERLKKENEKLETELARTRAALEVVGKATALLELISGSADSGKKQGK
jgi:transposase